MTAPRFSSELQRDIYNYLLVNPASTPEQIAVALGRSPKGILTSLSFMGQFSQHLVDQNVPENVVRDLKGNVLGIASSENLSYGEPFYATPFPHACLNSNHN